MSKTKYISSVEELLEQLCKNPEAVTEFLQTAEENAVKNVINYILNKDHVNVLQTLLANNTCLVSGYHGGKHFFCYGQIFAVENNDSKCFQLVQNANSLFGAFELEEYETIDRIITEYPDLINVKNIDGITLLYYAVCWEENDLVINLLNKGANINIRNVSNRGEGEYGWTALHTAAVSENPELMELLLNRGANPNIQDFRGCTPLHLILKNSLFDKDKKLDIIKLSLKNGANPNIQDNEGNSALDLAESQRLTDILNVIKGQSQNEKGIDNDENWRDLVLNKAKRQKIEEIIQSI